MLLHMKQISRHQPQILHYAYDKKCCLSETRLRLTGLNCQQLGDAMITSILWVSAWTVLEKDRMI